jgi:hypothetical protein
MDKQKIHGNNNQQAGRDIRNYYVDSGPVPNNRKCDYDMQEHLKRDNINKELIALNKRFKIVLALLVISLFIGYYFSIPTVVLYAVLPCAIYISALQLKMKIMSRIN